MAQESLARAQEATAEQISLQLALPEIEKGKRGAAYE